MSTSYSLTVELFGKDAADIEAKATEHFDAFFGYDPKEDGARPYSLSMDLHGLITFDGRCDGWQGTVTAHKFPGQDGF